MIVGIDNITPGTSTSSTLSVGSMRPYVQDLLLGLPAAFPNWQFKFFTPAWNEPFEVAHRNVEVITCDQSPRNRPGRIWFEQMRLPRIIADEKIDIWLGTCNYLPLRASCKTVLLVLSHQFFTNPEAYGRVRRAWLRWVVTRSVRAADRVGVQCEDAKRTLRRYVDVPERSLSVVYHRPATVNRNLPADPEQDDAAIVKILGRKRLYILYVSAFYPFKNHPRLIEAFARIRKDFPDLALILAGGNGEGRSAKDLRAQATRCGIGADVFFTGHTPPSALAILYRNARIAAFPSLEETFGLPVIEAMSFGCPVVTSNRSSMAEVAGDGALLVDPESVESIAAGMTDLLSSETLRHSLIRKGWARSGFFTKERTIQAVADALAAVAA
jgi:glycosyltransferase involved in cell wall biosynthesis